MRHSKNYLLKICVFCLLFFTACIRENIPITLHVISNSNQPIQAVELYLDNKPLGITDNNGQLTFEIPWELNKKFVVQAIDPDLETLYLPVTTEIPMPGIFSYLFSDNFTNEIVMQYVAPAEEIEETLLTPPSTTPIINESEIAAIPRKIEETDILVTQITPPIAVGKVPSPTVKATIDVPLLPENTEIQKPSISESQISQGDTIKTPQVNSNTQVKLSKFEISVISGSNPIANAQVFLGKIKQRNFILLGNTNEYGLLEATFPTELVGEIIYVQSKCCVPKQIPIILSNSISKIKIELSNSPGLGAFLLHEAYGINKGVEQVQLNGLQGKLDINNNFGLVISDLTHLGKKYFISSQEAIPQEVHDSPTKSTTTDENSVKYFVGTKKPAIPIIAFLEKTPANMEDLVQNKLWLRKFKRDFFARFIQAKPFKPVIPSEISKTLAAANLNLTDIISSGWQNSIIKYEYDFLLVLNVINKGETAYFQLISRNGKEIINLDILALKNEIPEIASGKLFTKLITQFPFEGTVTISSGDKVSINFGKESARELQINQNILFLGQINEDKKNVPNELLAIGKITELNSSDSVVKIELKKLPNILIKPGTRVVRVNSSDNLRCPAHMSCH